jgi:hypothetical protein
MISETLNAPEALLSLQQENAFLLEKIAQKERFYESEIKLRPLNNSADKAADSYKNAIKHWKNRFIFNITN